MAKMPVTKSTKISSNKEVTQDSDQSIESAQKNAYIPPREYYRTPSNFSFTPILVVLLLIGSFALGSLYTKVQYLEKGTLGAQTTAQATTTGNQPTPVPQKVSVDQGHLPIKGSKDAKVQIVEFADLRCPFCDEFFKNVEPQILKNYVDTGKANFAFRQYAILGPASTVAANAAECANEQNKFWDMHDYLYNNQPPETDTSMYTVDKLTEIAGKLGMNTDQFKSCLSSNKYNQNVQDDISAGQKIGINGTPTIYINGTPILGAQDYSVFQQAIDKELTGS